jgi:urocanate hydratase
MKWSLITEGTGSKTHRWMAVSQSQGETKQSEAVAKDIVPGHLSLHMWLN